MIYVDKVAKEDGRTVKKDDWEYLGYDEQKAKYEQYFKYLKEEYNWEPIRFVNEMKSYSVDKFDKLILKQIAQTAGENLRDSMNLDAVFNADLLDKIFKFQD